MDEASRVFQVASSEAAKTEKGGVRVKVTFGSGAASNFEMDPMLALQHIAAIGRVLDQLRTDLEQQTGGS